MATKIPTITLNNGAKTPSIGYGTCQALDEELEKALEKALEAGYRHIDTAYVYQNEKVIGKVLKRWINDGKLKREDIFLVTKLPHAGNRPEGVVKYLKRSLENLQVEYIDLYLIHGPYGLPDFEGDFPPKDSNGNIILDMSTDHIAIWKAMEEQVDAGLAKAIGLSNFNKSQIERILKNSRIKPSALQIELHAFLQQNELVGLCKENNILVIAHSPLGNPGVNKIAEKLGQKTDHPDILGNPTVKAIAKKHSKTEAQVLLRFSVQQGWLPIPKSVNPERIKQNLDIFGFQLDKQDVNELKSLDADITVLDYRRFKGVENHPEFPFKDRIKTKN
ncbi:hypothetical protein HHI36_000661 [Cryptolaemus montrouzieri]|uniref:NADP-dependent oxidoreductase domain-containing protein n=1 Tax=Cryptolaemus montrouzieri TaxID=559131 RepID=A0ABD2P5R1_9CUCU